MISGSCQAWLSEESMLTKAISGLDMSPRFRHAGRRGISEYCRRQPENLKVAFLDRIEGLGQEPALVGS